MPDYLQRLKISLIISLIMLSNFWPTKVLAQNCFPVGAIFFETQEEIDNFPLDYPDCQHIIAPITVQGEDITNLDGLSQIVSTANSFFIKNTSITSLAGLENLDSVGYLFEIQNYPNLAFFEPNPF